MTSATFASLRNVARSMIALLALPCITHGALTINVDVNKTAGNNYTGTAAATDSGTYWNSFVAPAAASLTLTAVRDSANNATTSSVTIIRNNASNFSVWDNSAGGGNPNPVALMRDYLFSGPYTVTISNLPAGSYYLFVYAHGDNTGQASPVTVAMANGGASGSTTDVGEYRNIYQSGAEGNSYLKLAGTVGASGTFIFTNNYINGFQLEQLSAPTISALTNQTVVAGTAASLVPMITGTPPPACQWRSNNIAIPGATNTSLTFNGVQYSQNGVVYSLVASNVAGAVTNSMTLSVIVAPSIVGLNDQAVPVGANATNAPTVSGVPTPTARWQFNGNILSDGPTVNGSTVSGSATSALILFNAQAADSGVYSLIASNSAGMVTNSMTLTVSAGAIAPSISGLTDQTVVQGSNATFSASVAALPLATLQWFVNGTKINAATNTSLALSNAQYSQNGFVYSMVASNSAGSATNSATLSVLVPPAISQQPTNAVVFVGTPAQFSVVASGVPAVKYQWSRNGNPIANATNAAYSIASVQAADNGAIFSVTVSNSVGLVISSNAMLTALSTMTSTLLPSNGEVNISPDQQLRIVFPNPIKLGDSGVVTIRDAANNSIVAMIDCSQFLTYAPGNASATIPNAAIRSVQGASYYYMPIAIYGNEAWITFTNRLAYNKTYYVNMDAGVLLDTNNASIAGISDSNTWRFSTKTSGPATPTTSTGPTTITIGQDGTGDFATFQGAFDWIPQNNTLMRTIRVKSGIYRDNATLAQSRNFVTIIGEGASRTNAQLIYPFAYFAPPNTIFTAGSLRIESSDVMVLNLTVDNIIYQEYHPTGESSSGAAGAFAGAINTLATTGKRIVFDNVLIKGGQDTIYNVQGIVYYRNCEVWGSVDYIYGAALAVFDQCNIVEIRNSGGPITAPNTAYAQPHGLVFLNSTFPRALVANGYPYDVNTGSTTFQRPWGQDGSTAIINCSIGSQLSTKGWSEWDGRETTCRAREAGTTLIGGGTVTPAQRQTAGAYWLNTTDPDYTSSSMNPTNTLLFGPGGTNNRVPVVVDTNAYTVDSIFGNSYYALGSWRPTVTPTITSQPTNKAVSAGASAAFSVSAVGLPDPVYQWQKNGTNISGATNATFTINSTRLADNGTYSVIVSNSTGTITSSNAVLTVPAQSTWISASVTNGTLYLSWPIDQTGFRLLAQTNAPGAGLTTNWQVVSNSIATNQLAFPINATNGSVFYMLAYP